MINLNSLDTYFARQAVDEQTLEVGHQQSQLAESSKERRALNKQILQAEEEARKLQKDADQKAVKAATTRFFGKIFGVKAVRNKKARKAAAKAENKSADARELELKVKRAKKDAEYCLDKIREAISQTNDVLRDAKANLKSRE